VNAKSVDSQRIGWRATLYGSAAKYLKTATALRMSICGVGLDGREINFGGAAGDAITIEGDVGLTLRGGSLCALKIDAEHPAFGSIAVTGWALMPETLSDKSIGASAAKLKTLATLTGARHVEADAERARTVEEWVQKWGVSDGVALPDKTQTFLDYYWPQEWQLFWIILFLLPFEVIIRRWHLIFGERTSASARET